MRDTKWNNRHNKTKDRAGEEVQDRNKELKKAWVSA